MTAVIYNRVSTINQNTYNRSVSLHSQEDICSKYAHENNLKVKGIYKEVHSAYNKIPNVLNSVINLQKTTIIISSIDRFSRSAKFGLDMIQTALKNKNKIIFVCENIVCSTVNNIDNIIQFLKKSEEESNTMSVRIKKAKTHLSENGYFTGGISPYGFKTTDRILIKHNNEQKIINFIKICKENDVSTFKLNKGLSDIFASKPFAPIQCYDKDNNSIDKLTEQLNNVEIASLLNSYGIKKRGRKWTNNSVMSAFNACNRYIQSTNNINTQRLITDCSADTSARLSNTTIKPSLIRKRSMGSMSDISLDYTPESLTKKKRVHQHEVPEPPEPAPVQTEKSMDEKEFSQLFKLFKEFQNLRC